MCSLCCIFFASNVQCKEPIPKIQKKYSQTRNCAATIAISTCVCERYIFPQSICLFWCRKYVDRSREYKNCSKTHECGNLEWGCAIPRKGIHKWDFCCRVVWDSFVLYGTCCCNTVFCYPFWANQETKASRDIFSSVKNNNRLITVFTVRFSTRIEWRRGGAARDKTDGCTGEAFRLTNSPKIGADIMSTETRWIENFGEIGGAQLLYWTTSCTQLIHTHGKYKQSRLKQVTLYSLNTTSNGDTAADIAPSTKQLCNVHVKNTVESRKLSFACLIFKISLVTRVMRFKKSKVPTKHIGSFIYCMSTALQHPMFKGSMDRDSWYYSTTLREKRRVTSRVD